MSLSTDHDRPITPSVLPPPPPPPPPYRPAAGPSVGPQMGGRRVGLRNAIVAAVVAALVSTGIAVPVAWSVRPEGDVAESVTANEVTPEGVSTSEPGAPGSIADVAGAASPSVAFVEVVGARGQGSGSAVIFDPDGYLFTNAHVVDGAEQISVTLPDGSQYDATNVGSDPTSDVAVLQIDATDLPALDIDADVEVGEAVVAIGSPFGLEGSVTSGIVSGLDRTLRGGQGQAALLGMIQTDAAINPGNSGGALVDAEGRLVGINTAIYSASGTNSGVGFAIPAASAAAIAEQLITEGSVTYAQLGITGGDVSPALAQAYELDAEEGALVADVLPDSGAAEAGLTTGDVIVALDGEPVVSMTALTALIRARSPEDTVTLTIDREGQELEVPVVLGSAAN